MRAILCTVHGPPEIVQVAELPTPRLRPGHVRIQVRVAAVNLVDVRRIAGRNGGMPLPFVPGSEFAGVVTEVAGDVTTPLLGARVFGTVDVGAFSEEIVIDAEAITPTPSAADDAQAAAFWTDHLTAYHVLRSVARVQAGERLVVLGAGSGVGLATVQLGSTLGCAVTAVVMSAANAPRAIWRQRDAAVAYGARNVIDHRSGMLLEALLEAFPDGADVAIDHLGGDVVEPVLGALRPNGRFVAASAGRTNKGVAFDRAPRRGVDVLDLRLDDIATDERDRNEAELLDMFAARRAHPHIGATFQLTDAADALRTVADGRAIGKVVLRIATDD